MDTKTRKTFFSVGKTILFSLMFIWTGILACLDYDFMIPGIAILVFMSIILLILNHLQEGLIDILRELIAHLESKNES